MRRSDIQRNQPQGRARVDNGNSITRGLLAAHTGGPSFGNSVGLSPGMPVITNPMPNRATALGMGWTGDAAARVMEIPLTGLSAPTTPFTMLVLATPKAAGQQAVACVTSKVGASRCQIQSGATGAMWSSYTSVGETIGSVASSLDRWDVVGADFGMGAVNGSAVWVNGIKGSPSSWGASADTYNTLSIGARWNSVYGLYGNNSIALVAIWNRLLRKEEHQALSQNPWQLFAPEKRKLYILLSRGVGGGVSGSLAATEAGQDTASFSGATLVAGSLAATEAGQDTASFSGATLVAGSLAATEAGQDIASFTGSSPSTYVPALRVISSVSRANILASPSRTLAPFSASTRNYTWASSLRDTALQPSPSRVEPILNSIDRSVTFTSPSRGILLAPSPSRNVAWPSPERSEVD